MGKRVGTRRKSQVVTEDLGADSKFWVLFRQAFDSVMARGEPAVHFRAARSFNRERPERIEATRE